MSQGTTMRLEYGSLGLPKPDMQRAWKDVMNVALVDAIAPAELRSVLVSRAKIVLVVDLCHYSAMSLPARLERGWSPVFNV